MPGVVFADVDELRDRWRALTNVETVKGALLLADLSREAVRRFPGLQARVDASPDVAADVSQVICDATRRRMTWEDNRDANDVPDPDLEPFSPSELARLRGPVDLSAPNSQAVSAWSNEEALR